MATSCAENSILEVFDGSLDGLYSSSCDSPSTCTTKTSQCSSASLRQNAADRSAQDAATSSLSIISSQQLPNVCRCINNNNDDEISSKMATRRSTRNSSSRSSVLCACSKSSSQASSSAPTEDSKSNCTSCSRCSSTEGQSNSKALDQMSNNILQYAMQNAGKSGDKPKDLIVCQWYQCFKEVNFGELLDHLTNDHVKTQQKKKPGKEKHTYSCKWVGCKVYEKPSTVYTWLERHIVCHLGSKPFRCIVDHCGMRFSSQFMLNRHVNGHFPKQKSGRPKKPAVAGVGMLKIRKEKKKKIRHIRPCPAISKDFFDSLTMSCIQRYITNFSRRTQVIGSRTDVDGAKSCLVRWLPLHILADEWMPETQVPLKLTQVLPLSSLSGDVINFLMCDW